MKKLRVLIVDDEEKDIEYAASMLRKKGHEVMTAGDGQQGVLMAEQEQPDLILMDVVMPVVNGFQATRQLSRNIATSNIPVIMLSCKDEEADKLWAIQQGAKGYLTKHVDKRDLFSTIEKIMN